MRAWGDDGDDGDRRDTDRSNERRGGDPFEALGLPRLPKMPDARPNPETRPTADERPARFRDEAEHPHGHEHPHEHAHPHGHPRPHGAGEGDETEPGESRPAIGIVGAGAAGTALGVAFARAGWPVVAVSSRDAARRERFVSLVPGAAPVADPNALLDVVDIVFITVPDDAIADVAAQLRPYSGQSLVHTSGAVGAEALAPAASAGVRLASFHPLVAFADVERAVAALRGSTVALEGDEDLVGLLAELADAIGALPFRLPPGTKTIHHAASVLAAGGFVALLDAIAELGRNVGLDEAGSLAIYGSLVRQSLANAEALGIAPALTGPVTRGDSGTVTAHLEALGESAPGVVEIYRALLRRDVEIARRTQSATPESLAATAASLANLS